MSVPPPSDGPSGDPPRRRPRGAARRGGQPSDSSWADIVGVGGGWSGESAGGETGETGETSSGSPRPPVPTAADFWGAAPVVGPTGAEVRSPEAPGSATGTGARAARAAASGRRRAAGPPDATPPRGQSSQASHSGQFSRPGQSSQPGQPVSPGTYVPPDLPGPFGEPQSGFGEFGQPDEFGGRGPYRSPSPTRSGPAPALPVSPPAGLPITDLPRRPRRAARAMEEAAGASGRRAAGSADLGTPPGSPAAVDPTRPWWAAGGAGDAAGSRAGSAPASWGPPSGALWQPGLPDGSPASGSDLFRPPGAPAASEIDFFSRPASTGAPSVIDLSEPGAPGSSGAVGRGGGRPDPYPRGTRDGGAVRPTPAAPAAGLSQLTPPPGIGVPDAWTGGPLTPAPGLPRRTRPEPGPEPVPMPPPPAALPPMPLTPPATDPTALPRYPDTGGLPRRPVRPDATPAGALPPAPPVTPPPMPVGPPSVPVPVAPVAPVPAVPPLPSVPGTDPVPFPEPGLGDRPGRGKGRPKGGIKGPGLKGRSTRFTGEFEPPERMPDLFPTSFADAPGSDADGADDGFDAVLDDGFPVGPPPAAEPPARGRTGKGRGLFGKVGGSGGKRGRRPRQGDGFAEIDPQGEIPDDAFLGADLRPPAPGAGFDPHDPLGPEASGPLPIGPGTGPVPTGPATGPVSTGPVPTGPGRFAGSGTPGAPPPRPRDEPDPHDPLALPTPAEPRTSPRLGPRTAPRGVPVADPDGFAPEGAGPESYEGYAEDPSEVAPAVAPVPDHGRAGRNLPAAIGMGVLLGALALGGLFTKPQVFVAIEAIVIVLAVWELSQALTAKHFVVPVIPLAVGSLGMIVSAFVAGEEGLLVSFMLTCFGVLLWRIIDGLDGAVGDVAAGLFTAAYVPFLAGFAILMLAPEDGPLRVVVFIVVTIASDIGGYIAGVTFGRHPMAPTVSPKKSWEGFAGSVVACLIAGLLGVMLLLEGPWYAGVALGAAAAVTATLGDLSESLIKRDLGVKDMGTLLPGHGGLMDRLDSLLPTAPVAYALLTLLVPVVAR
jgi:phosphatidate cytidylyltransferase